MDTDFIENFKIKSKKKKKFNKGIKKSFSKKNIKKGKKIIKKETKKTKKFIKKQGQKGIRYTEKKTKIHNKKLKKNEKKKKEKKILVREQRLIFPDNKNKLNANFYYYFPELRGNKDNVSKTYDNIDLINMNERPEINGIKLETMFNFGDATNKNIEERIQFASWTYIREKLNFYPIYLAIGILLFTYPNYRYFYAPLRKLSNWIWNKINIQSLQSNLIALFAQHSIIQIVFSFILSSIILYLNFYFKKDISEIMTKKWYNISIALVVFLVVLIIVFRNKEEFYQKINLICQGWMSPDENFFMKSFKYILFAQNTLLTSPVTQCMLGMAVGLHVISACFLSFVPYKNNGWTSKKLYLLLALILTIVLTIGFTLISLNCSFTNNSSIDPLLTQGNLFSMIFTNLNSNVLFNVLIPMFACIIVGVFAYTSLQTSILNSKFKIVGNNGKAKNTLLKLNNKDSLKENWKWYSDKDKNGILIEDLNGFDNVYDMTMKGENDPNFLDMLKKVIEKYDLPLNESTLYMILKINNKIVDSNNDITNYMTVLSNVLFDLFLYFGNALVVTTFVNGRNWGMLPIVGFDTEDESFTYKNWVDCLVNVNTDKVICFKDQKWDGSSISQSNIDWKKQYNKLFDMQSQIRTKQLEIFKNDFFEDGQYIKGSLDKIISLTNKMFYVPELDTENDTNTANDTNTENESNTEYESNKKYLYQYIPNNDDQVIKVDLSTPDLLNKMKKFVIEKIVPELTQSNKLNQDVKIIQQSAGNLSSIKIPENEIELIDIETLPQSSVNISDGNEQNKIINSMRTPQENETQLYPVDAPSGMDLVKNKLLSSTFLYNLGLPQSDVGSKIDMNPDSTVNEEENNMIHEVIEGGGRKRFQKSGLENLVKFMTLGLIKIISANFITNNAILYTYLISSIAIAVLHNKKDFLKGFINNISKYYQFHDINYIYHIEDNKNCGCDILDLNGRATNNDLFPIKRSDLLYQDNNLTIKNNILQEQEQEQEQKQPEQEQPEQKGQQGGVNGEDCVGFERLPKEPTLVYNKQLDNIDIESFKSFNIVGKEFNFGTSDNPLYANVPSSNPTITANVVTNIIEEEPDVNNPEKVVKRKLAFDTDANYIKGPMNDIYKYDVEVNNESYQTYIGSGSLFDTDEKVDCINPYKKDEHSQTRECNPKFENENEENPCENAIKYDDIINVETKKKSAFNSFLTKLIFLGVDYKKLFLQRNKYAPASTVCDDEEKKEHNYNEYFNNLIVGMIVSTIAIDKVSTFVSKHYSYIPPNAGVLTKAMSNSRDFIYNGSKNLGNLLPKFLFSITTVFGWFIIKGVLNTLISPSLTKMTKEITDKLGSCHLETIASPFIPKLNENVSMSGGGNIEEERYPIRIGKGIRFYEDKFYDFYKWNGSKYKKIKNLYINPVLKKIKAKNKNFDFDENILSKLIEKI